MRTLRFFLLLSLLLTGCRPHLPPAVQVQGLDKDHNGIRDDVQGVLQHIPAKERTDARYLAQAIQSYVYWGTKKSNPKKTHIINVNLMRSQTCYTIHHGYDAFAKASDLITKRTLNTTPRQIAFRITDKRAAELAIPYRHTTCPK